MTKQLRQVKEELFLKSDKLHLEDFGKLAQVRVRRKIDTYF